MNNRRALVRLLILLAVLGGVFAAQSDRVARVVAGQFALLVGRPEPSEQQATTKFLRRLEGLPPGSRIDYLVAAALRSEPEVEPATRLWVDRGVPVGSLTPAQREQLSTLAFRSFTRAGRRVAALLLLADDGSLNAARMLPSGTTELDAKTLQRIGLWAVCNEAPTDALARLAAAAAPTQPAALRAAALRSLAALGEPALPGLLEGLRDTSVGADPSQVTEALLDLSTSNYRTRDLAVPAALSVLGDPTLPEPHHRAAAAYLQTLADRPLEGDPVKATAWWAEQQRLAKKYQTP